MKKMILNTILVWVILLIILIAVAILLFAPSTSTDSGIGGVYLLAYLTIILVPITLMISGVQVGLGKGGIYVALIITSIVSILTVAYLTEGFRYFDSIDPMALIVPIIPFTIFLTSFWTTRFFLDNFSIKYLIFAVVAVSVTGLIILFTYFIQNKALENSYRQVISNNPLFYLDGKHFLLDERNKRYTGEIRAYNSAEELSGISYYVDGRLFGETGLTVSSENALRWSSRYEKIIGSNITFLLHKDYQSTVENLIFLDDSENVYWTSFGDSNPYSVTQFPIVTIIYTYPDEFIVKRISFHHNGVVKKVSTSICDKDGWDAEVQTIKFDSVGCIKDTAWSENRLMETQFSVYHLIKEKNYESVEGSFKRPLKMLHSSNPERWIEQSLFDNILAVNGIDNENILCLIDVKDRESKVALSDNVQKFTELISDGKLKLGLTSYDSVKEFQGLSNIVTIKNTNDDNQEVRLYFHSYYDGEILINDGPYFIDLWSLKYDSNDIFNQLNGTSSN